MKTKEKIILIAVAALVGAGLAGLGQLVLKTTDCQVPFEFWSRCGPIHLIVVVPLRVVAGLILLFGIIVATPRALWNTIFASVVGLGLITLLAISIVSTLGKSHRVEADWLGIFLFGFLNLIAWPLIWGCQLGFQSHSKPKEKK